MEFKAERRAGPIKASTSFGTFGCTQCMYERLSILSYSRNKSVKLINSRSEIYEHAVIERGFTDFCPVLMIARRVKESQFA